MDHARQSSTDVIVVNLHEIPYVDFPELKIDEHESTEMPFRYVKDEKGAPVMPRVCWTLYVLLLTV